MQRRLGRQTVVPHSPAVILAHAAVGGRQEGAGPLAPYFDRIDNDSFFGQETWEKAESAMQKAALSIALEKAGLSGGELDYVLAGDLLNQCIGSSFCLRDFAIPFYGLYGACSTMGESLALGTMLVAGGFAQHLGAMTSSHFCTAERQYRMPVPYGSQRPPTAQWTATAAGCAILGAHGTGPRITAITCGKIVDKGICDANNMGAAMAPAAAETILRHCADTGRTPADFDAVYTGDLGLVGSRLLAKLLEAEGLEMKNHTDCGLELYDVHKQEVQAGGSGAGCSAAVLCGRVLPALRKGQMRRVLFLSTGALMSQITSQQGQSIPGVAHLVELVSEEAEE